MNQEVSPGGTVYDSNDKRYNYFSGNKSKSGSPVNDRHHSRQSVDSPTRTFNDASDFNIMHYSPKSPMKTRLNHNFQVVFKLKYVTVPGEDLYVIGDLPQLGSTSELKHSLKWTEGHIWVSEQPLSTSTPYFSYKYVKVDREKKITDQEDGIQRVADLTLL